MPVADLGRSRGGFAFVSISRDEADNIGSSSTHSEREECTHSELSVDQSTVTQDDHWCTSGSQYSPVLNHRCWLSVTRQEG